MTVVGGGASNSLFRVDRGGRRFALRRPPAVANDKSSHDFARELRLMTALGQTNIPHARLVGGTMDPCWIGGPFVVLDWVDGFTPRDPMPAPFDHDRDARGALARSVIDTLADISRVPWQAIGLGDFGRPEHFLERQVDRWLTQFRRNQVRDLPDLESLAQWLERNRPPDAAPGLMHGDYSFANVMIARDLPGRVAAVVDWELTTIGDPLLDLGHLLSSWDDTATGPGWAHYVDWSRGMPSRAEAAHRYTMRSGRSVDALPYYMALAVFRLAILLEGSYARWVRGQSDTKRHAAFETRVPDLIALAVRIITAKPL